jgi:uncharacterized SAM-binding protein YcdF (DUF218 family)
LFRRLSLRQIIEGAAIGIALWCMLFAFQLLPGRSADTEGVLIFALVGMAIRVSRLGAYLFAIMAVAAGIVLVVTQTAVSGAVASRWVRCDPFPDSGVAAVVVLSAAVNPNGTMSGEALDHLMTGLELTGRRNPPLLVTTTVRQSFPTGSVSSETDQSRIVAMSGGRVGWIRMRPGKSTRDEAVAVARSLLPQGISHVAVVASPMHTRRACSAFEAVGFVVTCVPARTRSPGGEGSPGPWPLDRLTVFGEWVYEVAGTAKYQIKGWLGPRPTPNSGPMSSTNRGVQMPVAPARHTWCDQRGGSPQIDRAPPA